MLSRKERKAANKAAKEVAGDGEKSEVEQLRQLNRELMESISELRQEMKTLREATGTSQSSGVSGSATGSAGQQLSPSGGGSKEEKAAKEKKAQEEKAAKDKAAKEKQEKEEREKQKQTGAGDSLDQQWVVQRQDRKTALKQD